MIYTIYCLKKNPQKALYYGLCGSFLFLLFAFSLAEVDDTSQGERLSGAIYSTQFAQAAGMSLLFLVFYHYNQRLRISSTLCYSILPILAIILCGSRNGFERQSGHRCRRVQRLKRPRFELSDDNAHRGKPNLHRLWRRPFGYRYNRPHGENCRRVRGAPRE